MSEREDREAFERVHAEHLPLDRWKNGYRDTCTHFAWIGWQAALRYERERAGEIGK